MDSTTIFGQNLEWDVAGTDGIDGETDGIVVSLAVDPIRSRYVPLKKRR